MRIEKEAEIELERASEGRDLLLRVIYLDGDDDVVSICDRLAWVEGARRVLLVLPKEAARRGLLTELVELVRLRRCADRLGVEVGLVTRQHAVARQARALGVPTFATVGAAERRRRWWRRSHRRPTRPGATVRLGDYGGLKAIPAIADRRERYRRTIPLPGWGRWVMSYLGVLLFLLMAAGLFVAIAHAVPMATVTLHPDFYPVSVWRPVLADPYLKPGDADELAAAAAPTIPGRLLKVATVGQAEVATTGEAESELARARGHVVFVNRRSRTVTAPAGTRLSGAVGDRSLAFRTVDPVVVPGAVGGTAEAVVVAVEAGAEGNVPAGAISRIEGPLGRQLEVRNLEPLSGGGVRTTAIVAERDRERLRAQVVQQLQAVAAAEMEKLLREGEFLVADSLRLSAVYVEHYSASVGERQQRLALEMRAELHGTAVDPTLANGLIYEVLANNIQPGFELAPDSVGFYAREVLDVDDEGRVTFQMFGEGQMVAHMEVEPALARVAGQESDLASAYLYEKLPLRRYPVVDIWPQWVDRVPYLAQRVRVEVATE
ncbi:MAG: baseplate J/gp47 family protein [Candidatus Promineifilaceae bacterium]|nr:baseplate J/gp47 family protein [Candidatus Promineifilaceae bacterium]